MVCSRVFCFFLLAVLPRFALGDVSESCFRFAPAVPFGVVDLPCEDDGLEVCAAIRDDERVPAMMRCVRLRRPAASYVFLMRT
jgi:hypothetical protein